MILTRWEVGARASVSTGAELFAWVQGGRGRLLRGRGDGDFGVHLLCAMLCGEAVTALYHTDPPGAAPYVLLPTPAGCLRSQLHLMASDPQAKASVPQGGPPLPAPVSSPGCHLHF